MKSNLPAFILLLICVGLGIVVFIQNEHHTVVATHLEQEFNNNSNQYTVLEDKYTQQLLVNSTLETNLAATQYKAEKDLAEAESRLSATYSNLEVIQAEAKAAKAAVAAAATDIADKDKKIAALESQNTDLDKEASTLHGQITSLENQIKATQKKLDTSEGDNKQLAIQLQQLMSAKLELENRLSDLAALQDQVRTLKDTLSIARRIDWIQHGIYDTKGAKGGQLLISNPKPSSPVSSNSLDVEFHQGGGARINSPASTNTTSTNTPPARPPSGR